MEISSDKELTMEQRCDSLVEAICIMQNANLREDLRYHSALERYIIMVADSDVGNIDNAKQWMIEWLTEHPEDGTEERLQRIMWSYNRLSYLHERRIKDYDKAIAYFKKHIEIIERRFGKESDYVADELDKLAKLYEKHGDMKMAYKLRKKSVEIYLRVTGKLENIPGFLQPVIVFAAKVFVCMEIWFMHYINRE